MTFIKDCLFQHCCVMCLCSLFYSIRLQPSWYYLYPIRHTTLW